VDATLPEKKKRYRNNKNRNFGILAIWISRWRMDYLALQAGHYWLGRPQLKNGGGRFRAMLDASENPSGEGFRYAIQEICQQPATWAGTARRLKEFRGHQPYGWGILDFRCGGNGRVRMPQ
jgi:hypothetical protein